MAIELRGILVCVEYGDLLAKTLPYNRHHFSEIMVVTRPNDYETINVALQNDARVCETEAFYDDDADFNKWKALEYGLDMFGRHGWMCVMDADIVWPKSVNHDYKIGNLYSPVRHIQKEVRSPIVPEYNWKFLSKFIDYQWAGYTQIFHAQDPHLNGMPWYEINWRHAGGGDSEFQNKWPSIRKIRPSWRVLHLGYPTANWCGRCTIRADGSNPENAQIRANKLKSYMAQRRTSAVTGSPYQHERL